MTMMGPLFCHCARWVPRINLAALALVLGATCASGGTISFSFSGTSTASNPISGKADFTLSAGSATIKLTNTTVKTFAADELLTGLDFTLGGLTPTLSSKTGIERTVVGSGAFTDTGSAQNLTWSLISLGGGSFQLNFNPDATDAIIGPPTGGNYSGANGSVKGNTGHNPFAAQTATFVLNVPGLTDNTSLVKVTAFRYNTGVDKADGTIVPEPSTWLLMLTGIALVAWRRR
jgi:hypothetical protein